jgi:hypothetical protein
MHETSEDIKVEVTTNSKLNVQSEVRKSKHGRVSDEKFGAPAIPFPPESKGGGDKHRTRSASDISPSGGALYASQYGNLNYKLLPVGNH